MGIAEIKEYSAKPKGALLSLTGLLGALSRISEFTVSTSEFSDALCRGYDPNEAILYDGSGSGLADPIGENDNNGYNVRGDAISSLFNSYFWDNPDATIRQGMPVSALMVTKDDACEMARWLWSRFFNTNTPDILATLEQKLPATTQATIEIDPADLPIELDAANMAYRAVLNGYGNQSDTFKNRLIDYLQTTYTDLKTEAVQRIATVANPDKATGRKKITKE